MMRNQIAFRFLTSCFLFAISVTLCSTLAMGYAAPKRLQGGAEIDQSRFKPKARLWSLRYWNTPKWSKIIITASRPIPYFYTPLSNKSGSARTAQFSMHLLDSDPRNIDIQVSLKEAHALLRDVDIHAFNSRISQLSFSIPANSQLQIFDYEKHQQFIVVIKVEAAPPKKVPKKRIVQTVQRKRVILDPGHGGRDPGAHGFGVNEKDVTLHIAQHLQEAMERDTDWEVFLTRTDDTFLSIEERSALAQQYAGDFLISIHANAHTDPSVQGMETYFLDITDSQDTIEVALRENAMNDAELAQLNRILKDLISVSRFTHSKTLAQSVHYSVIEALESKHQWKLRDLGVKAAPFLILLHANMPSILLETSFISNPIENKRLQSPQYQASLSQGVIKGIQAYFQKSVIQ